MTGIPIKFFRWRLGPKIKSLVISQQQQNSKSLTTVQIRYSFCSVVFSTLKCGGFQNKNPCHDFFFKWAFVFQSVGIRHKELDALSLNLEGMFGLRVWLFATLRTVACQAPQSMEFSRQEYCSGLPFPTPGDLPDPGTEPVSLASPALAGAFSFFFLMLP